ncbi:MAG: TonB family protein, partial [Bacteroidota bacterium]
INRIARSVRSKSNIGSVLDGEARVTFNRLYLQLSRAKNGEEQADAFQEFTDFLDDLYDTHPENPVLLANTFSKEAYKILRENQLPIEYRFDDENRILVYLMAGDVDLKIYKEQKQYLKIYESDFMMLGKLDASSKDERRKLAAIQPNENGATKQNYKVSIGSATFPFNSRPNEFSDYQDGRDDRYHTLEDRMQVLFASQFRIEENKNTSFAPNFIHPIKDIRKITREVGFGMRIHPIFKKRQLHTGIDYVIPMNTEIVAVADGKVVAVKNWKKGYGLHVIVEHTNGYATFYAHLEKSLVKVGQSVKQGEVIALSGNTGTSTGPHLHYEVRLNGEAIDFEDQSNLQKKQETDFDRGYIDLDMGDEVKRFYVYNEKKIALGFASAFSDPDLNLSERSDRLTEEYQFYTKIFSSNEEEIKSILIEEIRQRGFGIKILENRTVVLLENEEVNTWTGFVKLHHEYNLKTIESSFEAVFRSASLTLEDQSKMLSEDYRHYVSLHEDKKEEIENSLRKVVFMRGLSVEILDFQQVYLYKKDQASSKSEVDEMPRFPSKECNVLKSKEAKRNCSNWAFTQYLYGNIKYPSTAKKAGIEGQCLLRFKVMQDGSIEDIRTLKDIGGGCAAEAKRVIEKMNTDNLRWIPAKKDGKNVAVDFTIPVKFKLQESSSTTIITQENSDELFKVVEQMPRFPSKDCEAGTEEEKADCSRTALIEYLSANLQYPKAAKDAGVEGMCVVQFIVEKDGSLSNINLLRDIGEGCGEAAKAVVEQMNVDNLIWTPGIQKGRKVRVKFTLPVKFRLPDGNKVSAFNPKAESLVQTLELEEFQLSPNPSSGEINVRFKAATQAINIEVYDTGGSLIYSKFLPNFDGVYDDYLNLNEVSKGTYFLTIEQNGNRFTKQMVVE